MKNKLKELVEKIELSNEKFAKLPKTKKRVMIAQDCLDRINIGHLTPLKNRFIDSDDLSCLITGNKTPIRLDKLEKSDISNFSLKERINNIPTCSACAKGSLFLSYVGRINQFNVCDLNFGNNNDVKDNEHAKLLEIFDIRQLALIEFAFEGILFIGEDLNGEKLNFSKSTREKAKEFRYYHSESKDRMIAICENIIANNGTFKL